MLADNARKEAQIKEINRIARLLDQVVKYINGDETAFMTDATPAPKIAIETAVPVPTFTAAAEADLCKCEIAVKLKGEQTCLICGKGAYNNKYVFSHTKEGKALLATKITFVPCEPPEFTSIEEPNGEDES